MGNNGLVSLVWSEKIIKQNLIRTLRRCGYGSEEFAAWPSGSHNNALPPRAYGQIGKMYNINRLFIKNDYLKKENNIFIL